MHQMRQHGNSCNTILVLLFTQTSEKVSRSNHPKQCQHDYMLFFKDQTDPTHDAKDLLSKAKLHQAKGKEVSIYYGGRPTT